MGVIDDDPRISPQTLHPPGYGSNPSEPFQGLIERYPELEQNRQGSEQIVRIKTPDQWGP